MTTVTNDGIMAVVDEFADFLGTVDLQDYLRRHPAIVSDKYYQLFSMVTEEGITDETEQNRKIRAVARERLQVLRRAIDSAAATTLPRDVQGAKSPTTFHRGLEGASPRSVITLERLVRAAPFPDDTRAELLAACPSLPQWKRTDLEAVCWSFIAASFHNDVRYRQEMATLEMAKGIRTYSREEMGAIAESEVTRITVQLTGGSSKEDRQQVWNGIRNAKPPG